MSSIICSHAVDTFMQADSASGALNTIVNYGAFYSTRTQTNDETVNPITFNVTQLSKGVTVDPDAKSNIVIANGGYYNFAFSCQLDKTDSGEDHIHIWLRKNGNDVAWTNTKVTLSGNNAKAVAAWNFFVDPNPGDYYELVWNSDDANIRLFAQNALTSPVAMPGIPSVILTVNQIG